MRRRFVPSIIPLDNVENVYLVLSVRRISNRPISKPPSANLLTGQYSRPIRVVAFNIREGWSQDVSEGIAHELRRRCDVELCDPLSCLQDFIEWHEGRTRQLTLRLASEQGRGVAFGESEW